MKTEPLYHELSRFSNSPEKIRELLRDSRFAACRNTAHELAVMLAKNFSDRPEWVSGWGHDFVCPNCASRLVFDRCHLVFPGQYRCPHCGTLSCGEKLDAACVYSYRQWISSNLNNLTVDILLGDENALSELCRIIDFYALNYERFPVHGDYAGKGRIMGQALDEAVWVIGVIYALLPVAHLLPESTLQRWFNQLFRPLAMLILPQFARIHNISLWIKCAVGIIALFFADEPLLHQAVDSPFGIRKQLEQGFNADGFWHECSTHYHFYSLEAAIGFFRLYSKVFPQDPMNSRLSGTIALPFALSHDGETVPSLNDGWYPLHIPYFILLFGRSLSDSALLERMLHKSLQESFNKFKPADLLLFADPAWLNAKTEKTLPPLPQTEIFPHTGLAVVRTPVFAVLKASSLVQNHIHADALSLVLPPFSDDLGTSGYGHVLYSTWYQVGISHNLVCVDGLVPLQPMRFEVCDLGHGVKAQIVPGAWPGIDFASRTLEAVNDTLCDKYIIESGEKHVFDWIFHAVGEAEYSELATPVKDDGLTAMYEYLTNVKTVDCHTVFKISFKLDNQVLDVEIPLSENSQVYLAKSPGNPADALRNTVIIRQCGSRAAFTAVYRLKKQG